MKPEFDYELDRLKLREHELITERVKNDKALSQLAKRIAKSDGVEVGSVVTDSMRKGKYSVTHFRIETFSGETRAGDIHYIAVYGVPVSKTGEPMKRREPAFIGPSELVMSERLT